MYYRARRATIVSASLYEGHADGPDDYNTKYTSPDTLPGPKVHVAGYRLRHLDAAPESAPTGTVLPLRSEAPGLGRCKSSAYSWLRLILPSINNSR